MGLHTARLRVATDVTAQKSQPLPARALENYEDANSTSVSRIEPSDAVSVRRPVPSVLLRASYTGAPGNLFRPVLTTDASQCFYRHTLSTRGQLRSTCASPVLKRSFCSLLASRQHHASSRRVELKNVAASDGAQPIQPQNKAGQPLRPLTARRRGAQ